MLNKGPSTKSIIPIGLKEFAITQPRVIPTSAGKPIKKGSGARASLNLT